MKFEIYCPLCIHEVGKRDNQEDTIYPCIGQATEADRVFVLCDGMGGAEHGEVASATVASAIASSLERLQVQGDITPRQMLKTALCDAYDALDARNSSEEKTSSKTMGTTLCVLILHDGGALLAHIGDSRIYHVRPSSRSILTKTRDHSMVRDMIELGEITPEQAKSVNYRNIITRVMQPNTDRDPSQIDETTDVQAGDYFYLCSDGMLEQMDDEQLLEILCANDLTDQQKRDTLLQATVDNKDNHSAILIHIKSVEGEPVIYDEEGDEATDEVENFTDAPTSERTESDSSRLNAGSERCNKSHKWLIALIAILVAAAAAFLMMRNCSHQDDPETMVSPVNEQPMPTASDNDASSWKIERHSAAKKASSKIDKPNNQENPD